MKLGPHVIRITPASGRWATRAPIVKALDNVSALQIAPDASLRVFRHYYGSQGFSSPQRACTALLDALRGYRHPNLYVEIYNEIGKGDLASYFVFLQDSVAILHKAGIKVAGPSWATGDYEQRDWDAFRAAHWAGLDAISLHAYWGNQGFTQWHALRYRTYWRFGDPPIIITECGRDAVEGGQAGWKKSNVSAEQYVAELVAYDREIARDGYVIGATPFTAGPTPDWDAFDTDPITDQLLAQLGGPMPKPAPSFSVGIGILAMMHAHDDVPTSSEVYIKDAKGLNMYSEAMGKKGRYTYVPSENVVHFTSFTEEVRSSLASTSSV